MALTQEQVSQLYVALFGRASEGAGNKSWIDRGLNQVETANEMIASDAANDYFGGKLTNLDFVTFIYANTLGFTHDKEGIANWTAKLDAGISRGKLVVDMITAALSSEFEGSAPQNQLLNRIEVSNYMATNVEKVAPENVASTQFQSLDYPNGKLDVTHNKSTVFSAKSAIDKMSGGTVIDGETFTLTTGVDTFPGTDKADLFKAVNSSIISEGTLQGGDKIDGGAGNDTLKVDMKQKFDGFTTGSMKNVEKVELTNSNNADLTFIASNVEGVTKYVVTDAVDKNTTISHVASLADIEISGTADTANTKLSVVYAATSTVATGTQTDVQNLKVTNQGSINTAAADVTSNAKFMTVDIDKVETLAITTAGTANSLNLLDSVDVKTITVTGEGQTEISDVGAATTSFDASGATGKVIATLTAAATGKLATVKSGAGDDTLSVALDDLTASAAVDMGAGADTLSIVSSGTKTIQATMSNVETIKIDPAGITGAVTFSGTNVTGLTTAAIGAGALGDNFSMANMGANALTVNSNASTGKTFSADNTGAITLNYNKLATATTAATANTAMTFDNASALTVNVNEKMVGNGLITTGTTGVVTLNVASSVVNNAETTSFNNIIEADSASSIVVNATGELINAGISADKATSATITTGSTATGNDIEIQGGKLTSLTITANGNLDMDGNNGTTGTTLTKMQTLNATTAGHLDFTGVAMADAASVTLAGTNANSQVTLNNLGTTILTHDVNLTATGLKTGLTTGTIDAGTAKVAVDISGVTGAVTLGAIDGDNGITLNAKNLGGALSNGAAALTTTVGAISVDVSNAASTTTLGALTSTGNKADVTLLANSSVGAVAVGVITGNNVTINGQSALGTVRVNNATTTDSTKDVDAKTSFTYTGTNLFDNGLDVHTSADSTAFTATLNGGAAKETIRIDSKSAVQTSMTVSGNLGAGTNLVTVVMADNTGATAADAQSVNLSGLTSSATAGDATAETVTDMSLEVDSAITYTGSVKDDSVTFVAVANISNNNAISISDSTTTDKDILTLDGNTNSKTITFTDLSLSGIEGILVKSTNGGIQAVTINASAISDKAIDLVGGVDNDNLVLTGTDGNDVIDLSKITTSDAAKDVDLFINGSKGNDTVVLSTAGVSIETVSFVANNGSDAISNFKVSEDIINVKTAAGIITSNVAVAADAAQLAATDAAAYVFANGADGTGTATITDYTSMTQVVSFLAAGLSGTTDTHNYVAVINDLLTKKAYVYAIDVNAVATSANTIEVGDVTLIGTITADAALTTTEVIFA